MTQSFSPLFPSREEAATYVKARTRGQTGDYNWSKAFTDRVIDGIVTIRERPVLEKYMAEMGAVAEFELPSSNA